MAEKGGEGEGEGEGGGEQSGKRRTTKETVGKKGGIVRWYSFPDGGTVCSLSRRICQVTGNCSESSYSRRIRGSFRIELEYSWMSTPANAPLAKPGIVW